MTLRPITILIAALGGEGGGVLTQWVTSAAVQHGLTAQSTSIPGVAQRTGATTYYLEIMPEPASEWGGRRPVLSLLPGIGDIDILLASELMEAGRAVSDGFVTPERTLVIASTSRTLVMEEKIAMGDGRLDAGRLTAAITQYAQRVLLFDMDALAKNSGTISNAVMLGALAGCERLPIPAARFEAAIRADGKAVEANLRGFVAGFEAVRGERPPLAAKLSPKRSAPPTAATLEAAVSGLTPAATRDIVLEGVRRLVAYQGVAYAQLYLERLDRVRTADQSAGAGGHLWAETARHLAIRMSFEDVIRVAQAKIDPARFERIAKEMGITPSTPYTVVEFLKPGIEELTAILPPALARPILALSARKGWLDRFALGMEIKTTSISGYLQFLLLSKLRRFRPYGYRYLQEQKAIERWLDLIIEGAQRSAELALEIVACAGLLKGYGDTYRRGAGNYHSIETRVVRPVLEGRFDLQPAIDAIASARAAALLDPEGEGLRRTLSEFEQSLRPPLAAQ